MATTQFPYQIIHLSKYYPPRPGGIETHVQTLARAQTHLGVNVRVLCVNDAAPAISEVARTLTVHEQDGAVQLTRIGRLGTIARLDLCPEIGQHLMQLVHQRPSLIHLHTPNPTMLLAVLPLYWRVPLVITHHSDVIRQRLLKYAMRPLEVLIYQQARRILTTSEQYIQGSKFLKLYQNRLEPLPLGLDCAPYAQPSAQSLAFSHQLRQQVGDQPLWLSVGRLVYYKALHIAIAALQQVPGILAIIGTGPIETELKLLAHQLGVGDRILWLGYLDSEKVIGAYHAATALWFPSNQRSEGFGLVQVEAMASGCPVINTHIPGSGVSWVSRHEREGLTIPLNDAPSLAAAARRLLQEPNLRHRLATASRRRAWDFDHLNMAQQSLAIYKRSLASEMAKMEVGAASLVSDHIL